MLKNTNQKKWHNWVAAGLAVTSIWATSLVVAGEKTEYVEAIPVSVESPMYPRKAVMNGTEGWVKLEFDLDKSGLPLDVTVLQSEPEQIFDKVALEALKKWKFKAKTVNGNATEQYNMQYTMEFKLADDENSDAIPPPGTPSKPKLN